MPTAESLEKRGIPIPKTKIEIPTMHAVKPFHGLMYIAFYMINTFIKKLIDVAPANPKH